MAKKAAQKSAKTSAKGKRKVSGKRGSPSQRRSQSDVDPRGVAGIVILCIGLLALASQFVPSAGGLLKECKYFTRGLGGALCLLLPVVVCWSGVTLVFFSSGKLSAKTMICGALLFWMIETMLQLFQIGSVQASIFADGLSATYGAFLLRSYETASLTCRGGGLIGALTAWPLYKALDVWGAVIVLFFAATIVLMVFTGVSFGSVGMYLSEMLDDLRVSYEEKKEEREALRASREEEELKREAELAQQRQEKRAERERQMAERKAQQEAIQEAQREAEAAARAQQKAQREAEIAAAMEATMEADAQEDPVMRMPQRKQTKQPKLEVVRAEQQQSAYEPPIQAAPKKRAQAQRRKTVIREDMPLYIERADEFTRESMDEREAHAPRRRQSFTIQEAEEAFLYGMNSAGQTAQGQTPAQEYAQDAAAEPAAYEQPAYEQPAYEQPAYEQPALPEEPDESEESEETEAPFWKANPGAVIESYGDVQDAPEPVEAGDEDEDEPYHPVYHQPVRRQEDKEFSVSDASNAGTSPLAQSLMAAQRAADAGKPKVQNVLAAQEAAVRDQTIVQLRENRLDGTPLVMPRKDTHEAPKVEGPEYVYPPIDLLNRSNATQDPNMNAKIQSGAAKLLSTLESFGVQAKLTHVTHGPAITRYELQPAPGVKVSRIVNLVDDIALNMASDGVRIEAPIPGKPAVGIEIPNEKTEMVSLRDVLESPEMMREKSPTAVALGKSISGAPVVADMAKMPHVLIAGATGSGKSVCINTIINSIIYRASPKEVRLILIDPKVVELSVYNGIPHLLVPVVTDPKKASAALSWAVVEMEHRYKRFETMGVRNIKGYNDAIGPDEEPMSKFIVIIDELADLMMVAPGEVEESICRLAQLARAAGIHLVIATQRPSVNVITGVIKANIPSRIAFAVSSQIDSRTILDSGGAEKLLGKGDMLYAPQGAGKPTRVQGCFVSDDEVQRIVDFVRGKHTAEYDEDVLEQMNAAADEEKAASGDAPASGEPVDEMLSKAIELAVEAGQVSISMLQRRLRVGYARAGRLVDEMTLRGITGEAEGPTKPRTVLISREEWRRMQENNE